MMLVQAIFWISLIALLHTYLLYPLLLKALAYFSPPHSVPAEKEVAAVSILIAAYNEEKIIQEKLESILNTDYPKDKIEILVGSDASTDGTNKKVLSFPKVQLIDFKERSGKVKIINHLKTLARHDILILTDANVLFDKATLHQLLKHFGNPSIALVDSNMINIRQQRQGVSKAESTYIRGEAGIKNNEGKIFGMMMGPFGGCYAVRKSFYENVPENFLVDDFFVNMKVLEKGGKAISEINAKAYEEVPTDWKIEFKRKIRIATGSFQNLKEFFHLLFRFNTLSFCFLSHKVLRWLGPFFMLGLYGCNMLIAWRIFRSDIPHPMHPFVIFFLLQNMLPLLFISDLVLRFLGINFILTRLATHFLTTNLALFIGFFRSVTGVKSSVWQPTIRT